MSRFERAVQQFCIRYLLRAVGEANGNYCQAARFLGIHRNTLSRHLVGSGYTARRVRQIIREAKRV